MTPLEALLAATSGGARLSVNRTTGKLVVEWDAGAHPSDELMDALKQHRDWLIKHLAAPTSEWDPAHAEELMRATLERIGAWHAELAPWCVVDGPEWDRRETLINAAYHARNTHALESALRRYERFAHAAFSHAAESASASRARLTNSKGGR